MIIIGNKKVDTDKIVSKNKLIDIQLKIIRILESSKINYSYDTEEQLLFELMLRNEIVKASKQLAARRIKFTTFNFSRCNTRYWNRGNDGGFFMKSFVTPSDAINDVFVNSHLYATECSTAIVIVYYKALLNVFGAKAFNRIFTDIKVKGWKYLSEYISEIKSMEKYADNLPGDRRYVINPDVNPRYPESQGENVIEMGNNLYYGHGIGITSMQNIIKNLNKYRKRGAKKSVFLMDSAASPNFKLLADVYYSVR